MSEPNPVKCGHCRKIIDLNFDESLICQHCETFLDRILVKGFNKRDTFKVLVEDRYWTLNEIAKEFKLNRRSLDHRFHVRKLWGEDLISLPLTNSQAGKRSRLKALERGKEFRIRQEVDKLKDPSFRQQLIDKLRKESSH